MSVITSAAPDAAELAPARVTDVPRPSRDRSRLLDPVLVAALTATVSFAGAGRPSLWFDEAATISASSDRSLTELWRLLGNIDAVHGLYYLLMHGWFAIVSPTESSVRVPSCLAVAVAAAGVVVLAKHVSTRSVAVCAGVAFAILPRTTWAGIEARPYAFAAAAAVWLTVLFVAAARRNRAALWLPYALALLLAILLNVYVLLLILAHGAMLPLFSSRRSAAIWWAATSAVVVAVLTPFLILGHSQIEQVHWISPLSWNTFYEVGVNQYFDDSLPFAIIAGFVITVGFLTRRWGAAPPNTGDRRLVLMALAWMVIPTGAVVIYSAFSDPIYYPRYLCFTAPAMALLLGSCIVTIARTPARITGVLVVLAVAATPTYLFEQRGPYAKEGMDSSQIADLVSGHAAPGDCLLLDHTVSWKPGPIHAVVAARPAVYEDLEQLSMGESAISRGRLWAAHIETYRVADRISDCTVLWAISDRDTTLPDHASGGSLPAGPAFVDAPAFQIPRSLGFGLVERWQFNFAQVTKATRWSWSG